ncbi:MAG: methyltransferase [bacterium]|nr:methyltransferase [bacterium]
MIEASFRVSPFSFFQTNTHGAQELFGHAAQLVGSVKGSILDLYCGTGSIGLSFLKMGIGDALIGIEVVADAIQDAWKNAEINKLKEQCFFVA